MTDDYRDHCRDCIHFAPWPERVERVRELWGVVPMGYPTHACMASMTKVLAVSPSDSPVNPSCAAAGCPSFERGDRKKRYKGVCNDQT